MKKKKIVVLLGIAVVIVALGGTGYYYWNDIRGMIPFFQDGSASDKVYVQKLSKVMNQYTGLSNRYNGTVESQDTFEVNVDSARKVDKVQVEVGDLVEEGQTLVSYDTSELKMQIEQAKLEVESINNDISNDNKQIEMLSAQKARAEYAEALNLDLQIQNLQNSIAQKQFNIESKQLEIAKYQTQMNNSTVKSKVAGVVKDINEKGTDANGNAAPFMTILQTGEYRVKGSIDEQNIWMLSEGQEVVVRSRVDQAKTWNGTISLIDKENPGNGSGNNNFAASSSDSGAMTATKYPFYIALETAEGLILGQHVYIELDQGQEEAKEGLWLYGSYIVQDDGEQPYVWAANDKNRLEKRTVELGEYDADMDEYEILSGITADDYITWPMPGLYEGVTTVTSEAEVDYSSPLYNQETGNMGGEDVYGTEAVDGMGIDEYNGTEMIDLGGGTEAYVEDGMTEDATPAEAEVTE